MSSRAKITCLKQAQQVMFDGFLKLTHKDFVTQNNRSIDIKEGAPITLTSLESKEQENFSTPTLQ